MPEEDFNTEEGQEEVEQPEFEDVESGADDGRGLIGSLLGKLGL